MAIMVMMAWPLKAAELASHTVLSLQQVCQDLESVAVAIRKPWHYGKCTISNRVLIMTGLMARLDHASPSLRACV